MRVVFKLYADLSEYLPPADGADPPSRHEREVVVPDDATPAWLIGRHRVPPERAHLVLVNGVYVAPDERGNRRLEEGDEVAIFPPVAGG